MSIVLLFWKAAKATGFYPIDTLKDNCVYPVNVLTQQLHPGSSPCEAANSDGFFQKIMIPQTTTGKPL
ncbi:hypothetical protein DCM91_11970 [Chitinophaga costaii]|nr:hypothetical protein DCM91_11970 [Chitinophaga costaii]